MRRLTAGSIACLCTLTGFLGSFWWAFDLTSHFRVQYAVALHQLGVATGTMNFFRALGSTFIVSAFGAIVLAGAPVTRGMSAGAVLAGTDAAEAFRWLFAAAILCLMVALSCILALKEQVLRGSSRPTTPGE